MDITISTFIKTKIQQNSSNLKADTDATAVKESSPQARNVFTSAVVISPDPLSPTAPTSSAMKTPYPESPHPSALAAETAHTPGNT
jgi:hypothetical protein